MFEPIGRGGGVQSSAICADARCQASLQASGRFCIAAWCHKHTHGSCTCSCVPARIRKSASARPELGSMLSTNMRIRYVSLLMGASCVWQCLLALCLAPCAPCKSRVCLRLALCLFLQRHQRSNMRHAPPTPLSSWFASLRGCTVCTTGSHLETAVEVDREDLTVRSLPVHACAARPSRPRSWPRGAEALYSDTWQSALSSDSCIT